MAKNKEKVITRLLHTVTDLRVREGKEGKKCRTITGYAILFNTPSAPMYEWVINIKLHPAISPRLTNSNALSPSTVLGASNSNATPLSSTVYFSVPLPFLLRAKISWRS